MKAWLRNSLAILSISLLGAPLSNGPESTQAQGNYNQARVREIFELQKLTLKELKKQAANSNH